MQLLMKLDLLLQETPTVELRGSSSKQEKEYDVVSQTTENKQVFSQDSSLHSSLPTKDRVG
jgi:hypothetical protein